MNLHEKTKKIGSVITQLSFFHKEVAKNRNYIFYLIEIILYLAIFGHDEKCDSLNHCKIV
jgi:hypothetical protein